MKNTAENQIRCFVLVVSVDLRFGQKVFSGRYSDRMICSEKSVLWVN